MRADEFDDGNGSARARRRSSGKKALLIGAGLLGVGALLALLRSTTHDVEEAAAEEEEEWQDVLLRAIRTQRVMAQAAREHPNATYDQLKEITRDQRSAIAQRGVDWLELPDRVGDVDGDVG